MRIELESSPSVLPGEGLSFLQSSFWGGFKARFGWKSREFLLRFWPAGAEIARETRLLVLERRLGAGFSFAYVPGGPALTPEGHSSAEFLAKLSRALLPKLSRGVVFLRYDPPWYATETIARGPEGDDSPEQAPETRAPTRPAIGTPLRRASADVQPPDTVLLDLTPTETELLGAMKPKWRYNIRLAEKKGVVVSEEGADSVPIFYRLYEETSRRDRIALHPESYYAALFEHAGQCRSAAKAGEPSPDLRLWVARHEGEPIAAIVTLFFGSGATYLYGASSDLKRNLMPAYALQWSAIRAAKAAGCSTYDFYGIPPSDKPSHPMAGLFRFKTGFGGTLAHYAGSWDYPAHPLVYGAFRRAESLRAFYHKRLRKLGRKHG